jgi:ribonuclease HI
VTVTVYCDGSGGAKPHAGGVGYVATADGRTWLEGSMPLPAATNQQAEILAAAYALDQIDPAPEVLVVSDSEYVVKGASERLEDWIARGWLTRSNKPVKNQPHWRRLIAARERHGRVEFRWVRGHAGTWQNERADELAGDARQQAILDASWIPA